MNTAPWRGVTEHDYNALKEAVRAQARRFPSNDVLEARPTEVLHEAIVRLAESTSSPENPEHYAKLVSMQCGWLRTNAWKRAYRWKDFCQAPAEPRASAAPNPAESAAGPDASCSLAALGPIAQGVVRLRIEGTRTEAVADVMGMSTTKASQTHAWALQAMRRKLGGRDDQG